MNENPILEQLKREADITRGELKKKTTSGEKQSISANDVRKMQLNFEYQLKNWSKSKRASFSE